MCFFALLVVVASARICRAGWPMPGGNFMRSGFQLGVQPRGWPSAIGAKKWTYELNYDHGAVTGPVTSQDGETLFMQVGGDLLAMDVRDGNVIWRVLVAVSGQCSAPVISADGTSVFLITEFGHSLHAFSAENGDWLWTYEVGNCEPTMGSGWSPVLSHDGATIFVSEAKEFGMHAVDAMNGTRLWMAYTRPKRSAMASGHPAVSPDGSIVYVTANVPDVLYDSQLIALDAATGGILWTYAPKDGYWMGPMPVASPDGEAVYVGSERDFLHAVNASDGSRLWTSPGVSSRSAVSVSKDSTTIYAPGKRELHALAAVDGRRIWSFSPPNFKRRQNSVTFEASHLTEVSISADELTVFVATRGIYENVGQATFYDFNQVFALDAAHGMKKWAYPPAPNAPLLVGGLPNQQYLDSVTYIAIAGDGKTLFLAESESFLVDRSLKKYRRPVYLHALDVTSCNVSSRLPVGGATGTCPLISAGGLRSGDECVPQCPKGHKGKGKLWCDKEGELQSLFDCLPNACDASLVVPVHGGHGACAAPSGAVLESGKSCTPSCDAGFAGKGNVTCYAGLLEVYFECEPLPCSTSGAFAGFAPGDCPEMLPSGDTCAPECPDGYGVSGGLNCTEGDLSGGFQCVEGWCGLHSALQGPGIVNTCGSSIAGGETCIPQCSEGYTASGNVSCLAGGKLTSSFECIEDPCDTRFVPAPEDGGLGNCTGLIAASATCVPTCPARYTPRGSFTCRRGKMWTTFKCMPPPDVSDVVDDPSSTSVFRGSNPDVFTTTASSPEVRPPRSSAVSGARLQAQPRPSLAAAAFTGAALFANGVSWAA